jgi:hypothetical protein
MGAVAAILVAGGIIALIFGVVQNLKAKRVSNATFGQTSDIASQGMEISGGSKKYVSVEGNVKCMALVKAPLSGADCLYWEYKAVGKWVEESKDSQGNVSRTTRTEDIQSMKAATPFMVDDGSGPVGIDASQGGNFDGMKQTFHQTQGVGLLSGLLNRNLTFGNGVQVPAGGKFQEVEVTESCLPMTARFFVMGKMTAPGVIGAPGWASMILTTKTRDDVIGSAAKNAKLLFMGGGAAAVVGTVLGVLSRLL